MSDTPRFEDRFTQQLRSYAAAGAPQIAREHISLAVAAGVSSRRSVRIRWPWRADAPPSMFAQIATVALVGAVVAGVVGLSYFVNRQPGIGGASQSPSPAAART